jgi:transcriptional regulator with XRE-family HTH domain
MYGEVIKKIRLSKNMNMREFSKLVDSSLAHISRLEKEKSSKEKERLLPPIDLLKQICDRSGYSFRKFLEEAGYIEPVPVSDFQKKWNRLTDKQKDYVALLIDTFLDEVDDQITENNILSV